MRKTLDKLIPDSRIFIDANIFLYSILGHPSLKPNCQKFLINIENGVFKAVSSSLILNEVLHKLMLAEVIRTYGLNSERDALKLVKENPELITNLSLVWENYYNLKKYPITIFDVDENVMDNAVQLSKRYGLLISDSTHLAIMMKNGIGNIATNDGDFGRIKEIMVWRP